MDGDYTCSGVVETLNLNELMVDLTDGLAY